MKKTIALSILILFCVSCTKDDDTSLPAEQTVKDDYTCGYEINGASKSVAKYWKNGFPTNLSDGTKNAYTTSIKIVGSDIYITGFENLDSNSQALYWKNGERFNITDGTVGGTSLDI